MIDASRSGLRGCKIPQQNPGPPRRPSSFESPSVPHVRPRNPARARQIPGLTAGCCQQSLRCLAGTHSPAPDNQAAARNHAQTSPRRPEDDAQNTPVAPVAGACNRGSIPCGSPRPARSSRAAGRVIHWPVRRFPRATTYAYRAPPDRFAIGLCAIWRRPARARLERSRCSCAHPPAPTAIRTGPLQSRLRWFPARPRSPPSRAFSAGPLDATYGHGRSSRRYRDAPAACQTSPNW